jgi:hypothetical protein
LRHAQEDIPLLAEKITNIGEDLERRHNTQGDAFTLNIGPQTFRNREKAGEALIYLARKYVLSSKFTEVGFFAGFELQFWPDRVDEIILKGKNSYAAKISDSPLGTISSMEHVVRSLDTHAQELRQNLAATRRRIEELRPHIEKPFEHEERLHELVQRQQELMKALDLNKNQASNQLSAEEVPVIEEVIQPENVLAIEDKSRMKMSVV